MDTDDAGDAIDAFERLGLTAYEAKVFLALQELQSGTARDVHRVADIPRSQVYSVTESLSERGLVEIQQSDPIRYRPVTLEEARATLRKRFEREQDRAFEYAEHVRRQGADGPEEQEAIWTVRGRKHVSDRATTLISDAHDRVVFGTRLPDLVTDAIDAALRERAAAGVSVTVVSIDDNVRTRFADVDGIQTVTPPSQYEQDESSGRVVYADQDIVLLSALNPDDAEETAIWSAHTNFAAVLVRLVESSLGTPAPN